MSVDAPLQVSPPSATASTFVEPLSSNPSPEISNAGSGVDRELSLSHSSFEADDDVTLTAKEKELTDRDANSRSRSSNSNHDLHINPDDRDVAGTVFKAVSGFQPVSPTNVMQLLDRMKFVGMAESPASPGSPAEPEPIQAVREKKLGKMRQSAEEMFESVIPSREELFAKMDQKDIPPPQPFIVPELFQHFTFYKAPKEVVKFERRTSEESVISSNSGSSKSHSSNNGDSSANPSHSVRLQNRHLHQARQQSQPTHQRSRSASPLIPAPTIEHTNSLPVSSTFSNSNSSSGSSSRSMEANNLARYHHARSSSICGSSSPLNPLESPHALSLPSPGHCDSSLPAPSPLRTPVPVPHASQVDLTNSEQSLLFRDLINEYVNIYWENPRSFAPFYKNRKENMTRKEEARLIYHQMKGGTQNKHLQAMFHKLKPKILVQFEHLLDEKSLRVARLLPKLISRESRCISIINMIQHGKEEYLAEVNHVVEYLRQKFMNLFVLINSRFPGEIFDHYDAIPDFETLNEKILDILFEPEISESIKEYHTLYQSAATTFPGRILLSNLFRNRIESRSFHDDITFNDLVIAVEESTSHLRHTIHGFMKSYPNVVHELFNTPPQEVVSSATAPRPNDPFSEEKVKLGRIYKVSAINWLHASRVYTKLFTPATFNLVKKLHITDTIVFRLISENKYQEALWRLKDCGFDSEADRLEDWMMKYVLNTEFITDSKLLGGGFTTTKLVTIRPDDMEIPGIMSHAPTIYGVWKPKPKVSIFNLQSLKDGLVSNHRKEVAAYRLDRLLHLNHVPLTKPILYEYQEGSIQYFITDVVSARDMNEFNIHKPKQSGKFDPSKGPRSYLPRGIKLFDYLIDNRDRNLDNYLISTLDQRIILIDHSWTFQTPFIVDELDHHDNAFLRSIIPNEQLFKHCQYLYEHQDLLEKEMTNLLSKSNIDSIKHRISLFVKFVLDEIKIHGREKVFKIPNQDDRRTFNIDIHLHPTNTHPHPHSHSSNPLLTPQSTSELQSLSALNQLSISSTNAPPPASAPPTQWAAVSGSNGRTSPRAQSQTAPHSNAN